ncbi:glycosyltransferase family 4 protein [Hyalangium versicolor]|uniref:glycosyltransferase family 4 protein n=1 Tax=Hyalangium versicolor TaxID=2861190 RepID=UPI001CCEBB89|nr:glycosyltransferase family 4 protein [Hyalangium versicolor]
MRILHIYSGNMYGGIETFLRTLARVQKRSSELVHEFALCFEGRLSRELREAGATVHLLGAVRVSRPWTLWRARGELTRLLEQEGYAAVVCHAAWPQALFGPVVRTCGVPLLFHQHDALAGKHWLERWARVTLPDLIISNSRFSVSTLASVYPGVPYKVRYYPVPAPEPVDPGERARTRTELGAGERDVVIVQACRMEGWKGHRLLLEALGRLRELPGWVLWVAGGAQRPVEERYQAEMEELATRMGIRERVKFLGQRTDVPRLLRAGDIHCQPNLGPEPFGLAFIEALQAGLPIVTSAMGAPLETIDGTCGVLVPPKPEPLAEALQRLIQDAEERRRLGAGGPARAVALCEPSLFLQGLAEDVQALTERRLS